MDQDEVVASFDHSMVERDRATLARVRVGEALGAHRPRPREGGHLEDRGLLWIETRVVAWLERRLARDLQAHLHHPSDVLRSELESLPAFQQALMQPLDLFAEA